MLNALKIGKALFVLMLFIVPSIRLLKNF